MSVVHVRYVRKAIEDRFTNLIDMSDKTGIPLDKRHQEFLSRGLAALAVQAEHPCSDPDASLGVFDGRDDWGLDAIAVDTRASQPRICLVQAKWSDRAKGGFGHDEVHKMLHGLDLILDLEFARFNLRFQRHVSALEQAFDLGTPKITLVLALMRTDPLNQDVRQLLEEKIAKYNQVEEMVDYKFLDLQDFHRTILGDAAAPRIEARMRLEGFGHETVPYKAIYGTMTVPNIADLFTEYRRGLFARNIRDSLDLTDVNVKIRNTLLEQPEHFWYFSNGITVLCDSIKSLGKAVPGGVAEFQLAGVSVVNGAQTVSAIHKAYTHDPDTAQRGRVLVRLISLEDCPEGFGDKVTTSTNTQNPIEDRDFKSLDPVQARLRDEFVLVLSLRYVIKRGEPRPEPEHGSSITEAAEALAAAHTEAVYAALAKRDLSELWQDDVYVEIFGSAPNVHRVWRCVLLLRAVRARLAELRDGLLSRAMAVAGYGDLLITHVIYRQLNTQGITDPDTDWNAQLSRVPALVEDALAWCLHAIDAEIGPSSHIVAAVRNTERIQRAARSAIRGMASGRSAPELNSDYQVSGAEAKGRQVDAAKTLVTARRIPDGTALEFRPVTRPERREMAEWLAEDPSRSLAIWRNSAKDQLQWQADGQWYSPSRLVRVMRKMASGKDQSVQGTLNWYVPDEGSLKDLADNVRAEKDLVADETEAPEIV
ncbi:AIPR protein [Actinokineospora alba]|uniref:AIPR protein n=1 Tax=Actinokineospora alba TaxID=504798 RepID=A0A1H0VJH1_9PSEU|nr:AIPR family protein [Actinokineospora alba]TDP67693.1 AIPR protein [Actinokineospora alba]SDJ28210.1 AIPR protein [Actinokineospora alba]SDP78345.1 AIPR protein [Actinokineospora alba]